MWSNLVIEYLVLRHGNGYVNGCISTRRVVFLNTECLSAWTKIEKKGKSLNWVTHILVTTNHPD